MISLIRFIALNLCLLYIKYKVPISLAFEDKNHRSVHKDKLVFNTGTLGWFGRSASSLFINMSLLNETLRGWRWETGKDKDYDTI